jgi:hypothetical protein
MVRETNRRRWIPGRQTLTRNYSDSERQGETALPDSAEWEGDATFDPSYGWLDLHHAERDAHHQENVRSN